MSQLSSSGQVFFLSTEGSLSQSYLHPVDEPGHIISHQLGVASRHWIMLLGPIQPVHHNDIGVRFSLVQGGHKFGHPTLIHSCHLKKRWYVISSRYNSLEIGHHEMRDTSLHGSPLTQRENSNLKRNSNSFLFLPSQGNCEHTREMLSSGTAGWGLARFKKYVSSITETSATYPT